MPKPLVDILDEELDKLEPFYELSNYPEDWAENKASAKQAIIKATTTHHLKVFQDYMDKYHGGISSEELDKLRRELQQ